jgi:hypothetical protein
MREVDLNDVYCIRDLLSGMIEVAVMDARNHTKVKSKYKQEEIDKSRESAIAWIENRSDSKINFNQACDVLGIDSDSVRESLKRNETIP